MAIIWRNGMSVGNDLIDHDHQFLINFINTIELILQNPNEKKLLLEAFEQFQKYAEGHFKREESIQRKIEYPSSLHHKGLHSNLNQELSTLIKKIVNSKDAEELKKQAPEIVEFLKHWLINHVLNEDLKLRPYLEKHPRGYS